VCSCLTSVCSCLMARVLMPHGACAHASWRVCSCLMARVLMPHCACAHASPDPRAVCSCLMARVLMPHQTPEQRLHTELLTMARLLMPPLGPC
jgi:hypothetical protein